MKRYIWGIQPVGKMRLRSHRQVGHQQLYPLQPKQLDRHGVCTLASFFLHPCTIKLGRLNHMERARRDENNDDEDGWIQMQCNDQFVDTLMQSGQHQHPQQHAHDAAADPRMNSVMVQTPHMLACSVMQEAQEEECRNSSSSSRRSRSLEGEQDWHRIRTTLHEAASAWALKRRLRIIPCASFSSTLGELCGGSEGAPPLPLPPAAAAVVSSMQKAVLCKETGAVLAIDFVFEDDDTSRRWRRCRSDARVCPRKNQRCYLATVYYSPSGRGGRLMQYATDYMRLVQRVCNRDMGFFPTVLAMCVYSGRSGSASANGAKRIYAKDVGVSWS